VFTLALCCICAGLLTVAHVRWKQRIEANENYARVLALVDALGLVSAEAPRKTVMDVFDRQVAETKRGDMVIWEGRKDGALTGYAVHLEGRGKYGPIKGILAFTPDRQRIKALRIYEQQETPGLGGRIASREWLQQFDGLPMVVDGNAGIIISSTVKGPNVVDAITGASKTTYSIGQLMNTLIARFLAGGMALEPLDLHLGADAVTRATPGYPKNLQKPPHLREEVRRPDFMVPPGTVNLALGKPVTSSMEEIPIIGELSQIVDGVKKSGEFDYVEMDPGLQWVQIDLEAVHTVYCIVVWHYYKNPVIYNDVIVQIADDKDFTENVQTVFNNDHDNSAGLGQGTDTAYFARWWGELVDTRGPGKQGTRTRYVRVFTHGGCGGEESRFVEIAVYGK
jgi:Na+-transporting NADH:ubiquinone oxidoreductase subunit NqrC